MKYAKQINDIGEKLNELIEKTVRINAQLDKIKFTPNWQLNENEFEPDSSPIAWTYFFYTYKDLFYQTYDFKQFYIEKDDKKTLTFWEGEFNSKYKRIYGTFKYENEKFKLTSSPLDIENEHNIGLAGDCCFNFNEKKVGLFAGLLCKEENTSLQNSLIHLIFNFHKMHYSPLNLSLMPSSGDLNNFKGSDDFDRLTSFLYRLNTKTSNEILSTARYENPKKALECFLNTIKNKDIKYYQIFYPELKKDTELYEKLLSNGKKEIETTEDIIEYLELAIEFWKAKAKYYEKQNPLQ